MLNKDIDAKYRGRAFYTNVFRTIAEDRNILADIMSKLITKADIVYDPNLTVSEAKNFTKNCILPVGTWNMTDSDYRLERWVGNAIRDCSVDLETVEYNVKDYQRDALLAGVVLKLNKNNVADIVSKATVGGAIDLSSTEKIQDFVMNISSQNTAVLHTKSNLDNATYKKAPLEGKPFIAASSAIINKISSRLGYENIKSGATSDLGRVRKTIGGVTLIDLRDAADANDRIVWGTAGSASQIMRTDQKFGISLVSGTINSIGKADAIDLDIAVNDEIVETTSYFGGKIKTEAHIFNSRKDKINAGTATI